MQAQEVLAAIERQSESHSNDERFVRTMQIHDVARQGDVYVVRVPDHQPEGKPINDRQLAPGTSKGSRHIAEGAVQMFAPADGGDFLRGPVIVARERFKVTHPEHADVSLPSGTYQVGYQLDPRTARRVAD